MPHIAIFDKNDNVERRESSILSVLYLSNFFDLLDKLIEMIGHEVDISSTQVEPIGYHELEKKFLVQYCKLT